jgi:hypothetical protein
MTRKKSGREVVRYHFPDGAPVDVQLHEVLDALLAQLLKLREATGNRRPWDDLVKRLSIAQRLADKKAGADQNLKASRKTATKNLRMKGLNTETRVLARYRYHRHKMRRSEDDVPEFVAADTGLKVGTVKNYLRKLRGAGRIA